MSTMPTPTRFTAESEADLTDVEGTLVVFADGEGTLGRAAAGADRAMGGALSRAVSDKSFEAGAGTAIAFNWPAGLAAERVILACLGSAPDRAAARKTGGAIAAAAAKGEITLATAGVGTTERVAEMVWAVVLRLYDFAEYKSRDTPPPARTLTVLSDEAEALAAASARYQALAEGVFFTRDLVNEPANRLTTDEFAARLAAMQDLGIEVEILGEEALAARGCEALLSVGRGSDCESKIVVMTWRGGAPDAAPLALVGKGVVFDTGGISIKPASGMEEMTMDMGGAGVVAGVMRTLALRGARANVVGVVGLVENMPDARATRPGDIVRSMKGDTIEVINTDAEGRMVLADALWLTQTEHEPAAIVDLATLTGAVIVGLGKHMAGFMSTDDSFAADFAAAAETTGDAAWRLPLGAPYARQLKSRLADVKNTGGRPAGTITAAEFLRRFVKEGTPWIHVDIAGVALSSEAGDLAPKGATGWGVAALDALIREKWEG